MRVVYNGDEGFFFWIFNFRIDLFYLLDLLLGWVRFSNRIGIMSVCWLG